MILFIYFYVYAVNYFRGIKADDELVRRDLQSLPSILDQYRSADQDELRQTKFAGPPLAWRQRPSRRRQQQNQLQAKR